MILIEKLICILLLPFVFLLSFVHRGPKNSRVLKYSNGFQLEIEYRSFYEYLCKGMVYFLFHKVDFIGPEGDGETIEKPAVITRYLMQDLTLFPGRELNEANQTYLNDRNVISDFKCLGKFLFLALIIKTYEHERESYQLLNVEFSNKSYEEALDEIQRLLEHEKTSVISFVNAHCLNVSFKDDYYKNVLQASDLILPDGIGVQMGCRLKGFHLKDNVNGTDLFPRLCHLMVNQKASVFLLGGTEVVNEKLVDKVREDYPDLRIVGNHHGHFNHQSESQIIIQKINHAKPDFLLVAFGVPSQEIWIHENKNEIDSSVIVGVGGLFDFVSGKNKRAPEWMRELGLEWIYRIYQEPSRMWKRYVIGNPKFIYRVLKN